MKYLRLFFLIMLLPGIAQGTTWYVGQGAGDSDANSCTSAQTDADGSRKRTIAGGKSCISTSGGAGAGHTLEIRAGTYDEFISNAFPSGTSTSNVFTFKGRLGETVIVRPSSTPAGVGVFLPDDPTYCLIKDIIMDGTNASDSVVNLFGGYGTVFENVEIRNVKTNNGYFFSPSVSHFEIRGGSIHDGTFIGGNAKGYGAYIAGDDNIVDGVHVYNVQGYGIHIYDSVAQPSRNIIRNCNIHDVVQDATLPWMAGILLSRGTDNVAYNNFVRNTGGHGIQVGSSSGGTQSAKILNNTIYANQESGINIKPEATGTQAINNIVYLNGSAPIIDENSIAPVISNNKSTDPSLVSSTNLHLAANSDAIDAGCNPANCSSLSIFSTDLDGNNRPQGSGWDIGADEYVAPPSSFLVDIPNGGETWQTGLVKTITWTSVISGGNQSQTFNATGSWTAPAGVTSVTVDAWGGGGGGGGNSTTSDGGGGGGGGAFARKVVTVTPSSNYTVTIGAGGAGGIQTDGSAGGDSWFSTSGTVLAKGGSAGLAPVAGAAGLGGAGGLLNSSIGDTRTSGGGGGNGNNSPAGAGGGGGGSGGLSGQGGTGGTAGAAAGTPGTAGSGTPSGAAGGAGGNNVASAGNAPGGGGGGSGDPGDGAAGSNGRITLTWASGANVHIELSRNNGSSWEDIVASTPDDGSYDWTVAGATTASALVRITSLAGGAETDTSNAVFSVTASGGGGTLTATSISGQRYKRGNPIPFGWTYTNVTGNVRIDLSRDNGTTWETVIASTPVTSSSQSWVAETPVSSLCKFRVVSLNDGTVVGTSAGNFRIGGSLTLLGQ